MTTASNGSIFASVKPFLPPLLSHSIIMLSVVLLFGLITAVNGNSTMPSPNNSTPVTSSSADGPGKYISATTASALYRNTTFTPNTPKISLRNTSTPIKLNIPSTSIASLHKAMATQNISTQLPPINTKSLTTKTSTPIKLNISSTSIASLHKAMATQNTSTQLPPINTKSLTTRITSRAMTSSQELTDRIKLKNSVTTTAASSIHASSKTTSPAPTAFSTRTHLSSNSPKTNGQSTTPRSTTSEKAKDKEKILWFHVTTGTLKNMLYAMAGVALLSIILLIIVCCCWRRQIRKARKLQKENTTLSNPYVNNHQVQGLPSPLQLDTFVTKPESPYDMPERVEAPSDDPEVSYITVVDSNESDSDYAAVKKNGTANSVADNESRDEESLQSPEYTNASVFQDPYEQLMPNNRSKEHHYTSLINSDEIKDEKEATV